MKKLYGLLVLVICTTIISSCSKDKMEIVDENQTEKITLLVLKLVNTNGGQQNIFSYSDIDGVGGDDPVIVSPKLKANSLYKGNVFFKNELETPVEDVTAEIIDENSTHQIFYELDNVLDMAVIINDADENSNTFGIKSNVFTYSASSGKLKITLQHDVLKPNDLDLDKAGGETDITVEFDVIIE